MEEWLILFSLSFLDLPLKLRLSKPFPACRSLPLSSTVSGDNQSLNRIWHIGTLFPVLTYSSSISSISTSKNKAIYFLLTKKIIMKCQGSTWYLYDSCKCLYICFLTLFAGDLGKSWCLTFKLSHEVSSCLAFFTSFD